MIAMKFIQLLARLPTSSLSIDSSLLSSIESAYQAVYLTMTLWLLRLIYPVDRMTAMWDPQIIQQRPPTPPRPVQISDDGFAVELMGSWWVDDRGW